ncbi:MAG: aldehyde ferredoxin oxidoreductase N-terminal domain-containing protein [Anaerolineae bacterium]|nr:aldehyde ferredoxin oxidoreductase N-terminal domain-containing protein [Anaerolineae bacterium]
MNRRLLVIDPSSRRWRLWSVQVEALQKDPREDYWVLSGEALCQYLLRRDPGALIIARGPLPFLSGNKASVGYVSPLTGLPHYSFVGGRSAAQLVNLGLDALWLQGTVEVPEGAPQVADVYLVVSGRAPDLEVEWKEAADLPAGQRSAYYWLLERELDGDPYAGSILTLGEGARLGYRSANLAAEAIYHAGRGGVGGVLARSAAALVLRGRPMEAWEYFAGEGTASARELEALVNPLLRKHCARLSGPTGGTVVKLFATGAHPFGRNTLPAWNAQRLGYALADLGGPEVLKASRHGHTGCHWCQVDCRHWHWVPADYAPGGRDIFLDDFEPTYAIYAMLGLSTAQHGERPVRRRDALKGRLDLLAEVNRRLILPIEQMGCDIMDIGLGLSALFEGVKLGAIPASDVPGFISEGTGLGDLEAAVRAVEMLRQGQAASYPALRAVGDGPQALAERYPPMQGFVFTCGKGTLGNAGHCNALWAFLMPFSRFFGHYSGQYYKVEEELPPPGSDEDTYRACFERVVRRLLSREWFALLGDVLSMCAFTFVVFSRDGAGEELSEDDLLLRLLRCYGIRATRTDLAWFSQAFWAQSIDLKCRLGWQPPTAADLPRRVHEALSQALARPVEEVGALMDLLIAEWKRQAREVMAHFGYDAPW